jgi:hypothetical protein
MPTTNFTLPKNGKQAWPKLMHMQDDDVVVVTEDIDSWSPSIVSTTAVYDNGIRVMGGVSKSNKPKEYNSLFFWVFDQQGTQLPDWPIDVSDHEDFAFSEIHFEMKEELYVLIVQEAAE